MTWSSKIEKEQKISQNKSNTMDGLGAEKIQPKRINEYTENI